MADVLCSLLRIFCLDGVLFFVCFAESPYKFLHNSNVGKLRNVLGSKWVFKKNEKSVKYKFIAECIKNKYSTYGYGRVNRRFWREESNSTAITMLIFNLSYYLVEIYIRILDQMIVVVTMTKVERVKIEPWYPRCAVFYSNARSIVNKVTKTLIIYSTHWNPFKLFNIERRDLWHWV